MDRRRVGGSLGWGLLTLTALALIFSGIGIVELIGDGLLALCLIKAGLKVHGHVIGGPSKARHPHPSKPLPKSSDPPQSSLARRDEGAGPQTGIG